MMSDTNPFGYKVTSFSPAPTMVGRSQRPGRAPS